MDPKFCQQCGGPLERREIAGRERWACASEGCGWVLWGNPTPVLAALIEHDDAVLLVRNREWPEKMFGLLTGFMESGETPKEGILREIREEVGLDAEVVGLIGVYSFDMMNQVILAYHCRAEGDIKLGDELAGVRHIPADRLRPWPMGTGKAVSDWLAARKQPD
ncbi:MAG: NUDIX hydrolase [Deltaproteobacteria bacterium]|nr:NUDIX hydrolase [Deltaproteobacteria bacterium]